MRRKEADLSHKRRGGRALVLPVGRELPVGAVVARQAVNARLDKDEAELRVLVAAVALQVLADGHRLLDKHVKILRDFGSKAFEQGKLKREREREHRGVVREGRRGGGGGGARDVIRPHT